MWRELKIAVDKYNVIREKVLIACFWALALLRYCSAACLTVLVALEWVCMHWLAWWSAEGSWYAYGMWMKAGSRTVWVAMCCETLVWSSVLLRRAGVRGAGGPDRGTVVRMRCGWRRGHTTMGWGVQNEVWMKAGSLETVNWYELWGVWERTSLR